MANFVLIDKKSLNEISVDTANISLQAPSSVHTKLHRNEVSEFIQDGNNLILKLKNGKTIVVKNFFVVKNDLESELVFEDEAGMPWLPFLLGGAAAAGAIAALASDGDNTTKNNPTSVVAGKEKQPTIAGEGKPKTGNITYVKDPDDDQLTYKITEQPKNGIVTIDTNTGEYTYIPNKDFNGGDTFTVIVDDGKGGTTRIEVPVSVIPAATVEVIGYEDNVGNAPENIASGKSTNDNKPVISGVAKNAETVEVTITDAQGKVVKTLTVPVNKDGKWSTPELPDALKDGDYTITAKAKDALGNEVASNDYTVTVDTTVDAGQPEIVTDLDGDSTITTTVDPKDVTKVEVIDPTTKQPIPGLIVKGPDADGKVVIEGKVPAGVDPELKVTDKVGNEITTPITDKTLAATVSVDGYEDNVKGGIEGNVASGESTNDNTPVISGTATNAKTVDVYIDGKLVGTATVGTDGQWTLPESAITTPLSEGPHTITAVAKDGLGRPVTSKDYTVTVDTTVGAGKPHIEIDNNGNVTITTTVDPKDVTKVEIVDKDGNPVLDVDTNEPLVGIPDADGKVVIEGKIPPEVTTPELKVTDKAGNTTKVPTPFILEDEAFDGKIVAGSDTAATYMLSDRAAILDAKTGKYTLSTPNGTVILDANTGEYTYTPNKDFSGSDTFTVSVSDANGTKEITIPIFVTAVADTPLVTESMEFNAGYETDKIKLEKINAKLTDIDGSETLTVALSNVPAGTKLIVTSVDNQGKETLVEVTADSKGQITLTGEDNIVEFKDFELELPKGATVGTETVTVEVTATEKSNGDSKSDSFDFEVTVKDPADLIVTMKVEAAGNGDDAIVGQDGTHNVLVGDQGGVQTNFVAGHDYNVAIVLDVSGSMYASMGNTDRMTVAKEGLKLFVSQMAKHQGEINFTLITFDFDAKAYGTFKVTQNNLQEVWDKIDSIPKENKGTSPEAGFDLANMWFNQQTNSFENQTYFITDGDPSGKEQHHWYNRDAKFKPLAEQSKVFAVGLGEVHVDNVKRYDNTDEFGNKIENWSKDNTGSAQVLQDKEALISYLIGGSENFKPAEAGNDKVTGGNGNDILFGDAINTNHLVWDGRDSVKHPQYSGYSTLIDYLKATVTGGAEPTEQQIYKYLQENYMDFVKADANDPNVKGGNDIIDGGAGNDIIIAGAGNDLVIASQSNDIISTGPGNDALLYKLLSGLETENTGGHGVDTWVDFALGNPATNDNADVLKFSEDFFTGLTMKDLLSDDSSTVGNFITVDYDEASQTATISVDRDGEGSGYTAETLLHLTHQDKEITLDDLLVNHQIVIG